MIRHIFLKYEVDPLRNKEVTVKNHIFFWKILSSRGDKSENIGARIMNLVT
jgi:superoxide dismutase